MKSKIIISILVLIFFIGVVSSSNIEDIGFNISSELKPNGGNGFQLEDGKGNTFIISEKELSNLDSEYKKYNETTYIYNESIVGESLVGSNGKELAPAPSTQIFSYGEFIKVDGKTYEVLVRGNFDNPDYNKCLEYLNYFNEHNKVELVKIFD